MHRYTADGQDAWQQKSDISYINILGSNDYVACGRGLHALACESYCLYQDMNIPVGDYMPNQSSELIQLPPPHPGTGWGTLVLKLSKIIAWDVLSQIGEVCCLVQELLRNK